MLRTGGRGRVNALGLRRAERGPSRGKARLSRPGQRWPGAREPRAIGRARVPRREAGRARGLDPPSGVRATDFPGTAGTRPGDGGRWSVGGPGGESGSVAGGGGGKGHSSVRSLLTPNRTSLTHF